MRVVQAHLNINFFVEDEGGFKFHIYVLQFLFSTLDRFLGFSQQLRKEVIIKIVIWITVAIEDQLQITFSIVYVSIK